jgi:ferredoxin
VRLHWNVNGEKVDVDAPIGKNLMEVAHDNDIELEGGCEEFRRA